MLQGPKKVVSFMLENGRKPTASNVHTKNSR